MNLEIERASNGWILSVRDGLNSSKRMVFEDHTDLLEWVRDEMMKMEDREASERNAMVNAIRPAPRDLKAGGA